MRKLLWKVMPPFEVSVLIKEAEKIIDEVAGLCRTIIKQEAVLAIKKYPEETVRSIRIEHKKPEHLALLLIRNAAGYHLGSGRYHVYRGTLDLMGHDMFKVWKTTQKRLIEQGYCTQEEIDEADEVIEEEIESMG